MLRNVLIAFIILLSMTRCSGYKQTTDSVNANVESPPQTISTLPNSDCFSCNDIKYLHNKLTGITTYNSPVTEIGELSASNRNIAAISFSKEITETDTLSQLGIVGSTAEFLSEAQGALVTAENGDKIDVPEVNFILVQTSSVAYIYFGAFILSVI